MFYASYSCKRAIICPKKHSDHCPVLVYRGDNRICKNNGIKIYKKKISRSASKGFNWHPRKFWQRFVKIDNGWRKRTDLHDEYSGPLAVQTTELVSEDDKIRFERTLARQRLRRLCMRYQDLDAKAVNPRLRENSNSASVKLTWK
jgi:hypothetical protein